MSRALITTLLVAGTITGTAQAQTLTAGTRIRVLVPALSSKPIEGIFERLRGDTLVVNVQAWERRLELPLSSVEQLKMHSGRRSAARRGAAIGALVGAAAGGIGAAATYEDPCPEGADFCIFDVGPVGEVVLSAIVFGAIGAGTGAVIGSFIKVDRWETVPLDRIRISLTPRGGGLEVSAKFVF